MSYMCNFCYNSYSTRGGRTRHLHFCREKKKYEKRKHSRELEKARENATIINNTYYNINNTYINVVTQNRIENDLVLFEGFTKKLIYEIRKVRWESAENAMLQLNNIKQKIQTSSDADKKICEWLESDEIEREEIDKVDNQVLRASTADKVDEIEDGAIEAITSRMPKEEGEKFKKLVSKGIFA